MKATRSLIDRMVREARSQAALAPAPDGAAPLGFATRVAARWASSPVGRGLGLSQWERLTGRAAGAMALLALLVTLATWQTWPAGEQESDATLESQLSEIVYPL